MYLAKLVNCIITFHKKEYMHNGNTMVFLNNHEGTQRPVYVYTYLYIC